MRNVSSPSASAFGMIVDRFLGATLEGGQIGNQGVNLLATLVSGVVTAVAAFVL
jgi:uncharacterized membrane protein